MSRWLRSAATRSRQTSCRDAGPLPGRLPLADEYLRGQYTSVRFTEHLALESIRPSIGSIGDAYDTLMDSVIGLFKTECIRITVFHDKPYRTISDVEFAADGWVALPRIISR